MLFEKCDFFLWMFKLIFPYANSQLLDILRRNRDSILNNTEIIEVGFFYGFYFFFIFIYYLEQKFFQYLLTLLLLIINEETLLNSLKFKVIRFSFIDFLQEILATKIFFFCTTPSSNWGVQQATGEGR